MNIFYNEVYYCSVFLVHKQTWIYVTDNTNVRWLRIFQLYKGFFRKTTKESFFVKGSARVVEPPRLEYKGFKYKYKVKGNICRAWLVRTKTKVSYKDSRGVLFCDNSGILINKKANVMSKYINGPVARSIGRKKLVSLFKQVL